MTDHACPLPALDPGNSAFWTGGRLSQLPITRCHACQRWFRPPVPVCRFCLSIDVAPEPCSGRGRVLTYTVNRHQWLPGLRPPYVIAVIGLDDDPDLRITTRLADVDPAAVEIDMRVRVRFTQAADVWIPLFGPEDPDEQP